MVKIFIGGYPLNMDELRLVQMVSPYGQVATIKMVRDRQTKKPKGYAFLEITEQEGAERIIEALDGVPMGDKEIKVSIVPPEQEMAAKKPMRPAMFKKVDRGGAPSYGDKPKRPRRSF